MLLLRGDLHSCTKVCKEELSEVYVGNDHAKALKELNKGQPLKGSKDEKHLGDRWDM